MTKKQLIIFDLDDTLVDTSHVYWISRTRFVDALEAEGMTASLVLEMFEQQDERNMREMGFAPERYEKTMVDIYERLVFEGKIKGSEKLAEYVRECGRVVVQQLPEVIDGAKDLLRWAQKRFKLVLVTRGIELMQRRKIASSEIGLYFEEVRVVTKKDASDFAKMISDHGVEPQNTWVIGDSIRSDINPALQIGARPILYVYTHHSYYWRQEYGVIPLGNFYKIDALDEAVKIFKNPKDYALTTPEGWAAAIENLPQRE